MLEPLTQLFLRLKLSPYLSGLLYFVCIYGVYLHLGVFMIGSSTLIFTSPISCSVPKDSTFTESYVNTRCANKPLLRFEEEGLKAIAEKREKERVEEMKKQSQGRRNNGWKRQFFVAGNNDDTSDMVSYYR